MVEWTRHSSFIMAVKRSRIGALPHGLQEEFRQMLLPFQDPCHRPGMDQIPRWRMATSVQISSAISRMWVEMKMVPPSRTYSLRYSFTFCCMTGSKLISGSSMRASTGRWRNAWRTSASAGCRGEVLAQDVPLVLKLQEPEPPAALSPHRPVSSPLPRRRGTPRREEAGRRFLLGDDPHLLPHRHGRGGHVQPEDPGRT